MLDLLQGVRVLDFSHVHAGPLCAYQLALMGAEVVKVEPPEGDQMRLGPGAEALMSHGFVGQGANKQSVCIDLKQPDGLALVHQLMANADIVLHNMRPGTPDRIGIGVADAQRLNPKVIYCAISGYGQEGPYALRPALDHLMQGESGMFAATGPGEGPAMRVGFAVADASSALVASSAIAAALFRRERTGQGAFIDVSMLESCITVMGLNMYGYLGSGAIRPRVGPDPLADVGSAGTFQTSAGTLLVNANNYRLFERLARALAREDLLERYPGVAFQEQWQALRAEFADHFATDTADHFEAILSAAGVPVGQVRDLHQVFASPQLSHRAAVTELEGRRYTGAGFQVDGVASTPTQPAQALGAATREVLAGIGLEAAEVDRLLAQGIVFAAKPEA